MPINRSRGSTNCSYDLCNSTFVESVLHYTLQIISFIFLSLIRWPVVRNSVIKIPLTNCWINWQLNWRLMLSIKEDNEIFFIPVYRKRTTRLLPSGVGFPFYQRARGKEKGQTADVLWPTSILPRLVVYAGAFVLAHSSLVTLTIDSLTRLSPINSRCITKALGRVRIPWMARSCWK